ncbi:hypothetical protein SDC9_21319 [bioreactor metagenome]|uniref:Uncharacterized protein n=1 Tax=bioreactor metagenome TaxID=1076179 RepID=A0A644U964_9ZZZZ
MSGVRDDLPGHQPGGGNRHDEADGRRGQHRLHVEHVHGQRGNDEDTGKGRAGKRVDDAHQADHGKGLRSGAFHASTDHHLRRANLDLGQIGAPGQPVPPRRAVAALAGKLEGRLAAVADQRGGRPHPPPRADHHAARRLRRRALHQRRHRVALGTGEIAEPDHLDMVLLAEDDQVNAVERQVMPLGTEEHRPRLRAAGHQHQDDRQGQDGQAHRTSQRAEPRQCPVSRLTDR